MSKELAQELVGRLRGLGFSDEVIQYQFTGAWDGNPELEMAESPVILPAPDPLIEVRSLTDEEISENHTREGLRDIIEMAAGDRPAGNVNKGGLVKTIRNLIEGA